MVLNHLATPTRMSKKQKKLYIDIRKLIAMYIEALTALGYNQKTISEEAIKRYNLKLTTSGLTKSKCTDEEEILSKDYVQMKTTLMHTKSILGRMLWDEAQQKTESLNIITGVFNEHKVTIDSLNNYNHVTFIHASEEEKEGGMAQNKDDKASGEEQYLSLDFCNIKKYDYLMSALKASNALQIGIYALLFYCFIPYTIAFWCDKWAGAGYTFYDSNTMVFAYPISAIPMAFIFLFYNSFFTAFSAFGEHSNNKVLYQETVRKAFTYYPLATSFIWLASILCVIGLHISYLHDDMLSFLESSIGVPNLLFFLNIVLFSWHIFMFLHILLALYIGARALKAIAANFFHAKNKIISNPENSLVLMLPLGKPLSRLLIVFIFIVMYALFFFMSMYAVYQKTEGLLLMNWQIIEVALMFIPLVAYLIMTYLYIKPITQLYMNKEKVMTKDCLQILLRLVSSNMVFGFDLDNEAVAMKK